MKPFEIGRKLLRINLSDISAMGGGKLVGCTVIAGIVKSRSIKRYIEVVKGVKYEAEKLNLNVFAGDTDSTPLEYFYLTLLATTDKVVLRSRANLKDLLCLTGKIGAAYAGMMALKKKETSGFIESFKLPPVRLHEAKKIKPYATSMIDLSDGLAKGVEVLAKESKCGFNIYVERIPFATKKYPLEQLIKGGEDYELLFTVNKNDVDKIKTRFTIIGEATGSEINYIYGKKIKIEPYEKF